MKDIADFRVKQVRIFAPDQLPFALLRTGIGSRSFGAQFGVANSGIDEVSGDLVFQAGALTFEDDSAAPIVFESVQINDRRIIVSVTGESDKATQLYEGIRGFLSALSPKDQARWESAEPVVFTEESSCVATLDIDWPRILAPPLENFIMNRVVHAAAEDGADAELLAMKLSFIIGYKAIPDRVRHHSIVYSPKEFRLETRVRTPIGERRFFSASPTSSQVHLELMAEIERTLAAKIESSARDRER